MGKKLRIIHTNDLHSHFENWPRVKRFVKQRQVADGEECVLTVDLGDFMDRWHPLTEATNGQANIEELNALHYDAITIGNNEGIGNGKECLNHLFDYANFAVVLANLFDKTTLLRPKWAQPYKIMTLNNGLTIAMIGMTAPFPLTYAPNGWDVRDPLELLPEFVNELRPQVDVLILLSHLGIQADYTIADEFPQFDVIIGSHTHHLFPNGEKRNSVQLAAAGKFGRYVGEVELHCNDTHITSAARTFSIEEMLAYPEDEQQITKWALKGHEQLAKLTVGYLPYPLTNDPQLYEHSLIEEALDAVRKRGATDSAILNSGLFLESLPVGRISQDQVHSILPHPMHLIRVRLQGKDLIRMILEMEKNRLFLSHYQMVGMGFRGKIFGQIRYLGISYDATNHQVYWQGKPVDEQQNYSFTTVDHFMFIPFFPTIEIAGDVTFLFPEFIRTVVGNDLQNKFPLT